MAFIVVKNCLLLIKGITVKLQKRDVDVISADNMIDDTKQKIVDLRTNLDAKHEEWFKEAKETAEEVGAKLRMPQITRSQVYLVYVDSIAYYSSIHSDNSRSGFG